MRLWPILVVFPFAVAAGLAQTGTPVDTIAEARRLRDANDFVGAAALMRAYVDSHPDDSGSARFAALMAYWAKDQPAADSIYARALTAHPDDANLRLEYARFLTETGAIDRAAIVLAPLVASDSARYRDAEIARAHALIGTGAYWRGDYVAARREFRTALRLDSTVTDARRDLAAIETAAASWIRISSELWDDDQPLRFLSAEADGGWFANPLTPLGARVRSTLFDVGGGSESMIATEANFATYLASAHLDLRGGAGVLQRSFDQTSDWTARISLGVRLPRQISLDASYERSPYTNTVSSLSRAIMVETLAGGAHWGTSRGWMGQVTARVERYPDANRVGTGFGWILAPLTSREAATLHVGYGFTAQSADSNHFVPRDDISVRPGGPPTEIPGEYNPYYTPSNLRVHSALANAHLKPNARWTIDLAGRYALSAREDAPVLFAVATPPTTEVTRTFYRRAFTPWNARGTIDLAASRAVHLGVGLEHGREAYYAFTTARLQLTYTFLAAAEKRAELR